MKRRYRRILIMFCLAFAFAFMSGRSVHVSAAAKQYTLKIYTNNGSKVQRTYKVKKGTKIQLPSIYSPNKKTLLGFSTKKNQHSNPKYLVGQTITVNKNIKLYNVIFYSKNEKNIAKSSLLTIKNVSYKNVIFVGDSRTYLCFDRELTEDKYPALHDHIYHIALGGSGINYIKDTAYSDLITLLKKLKKEKTAIIFNSGVNDLWNIDSYITYMNEIAPTLKSYNCRLFYMSINPVSTKNREKWNLYYKEANKKKPEHQLLVFNKKIKGTLCASGGNYTYIDTFTYLIKNGFTYRYRAANKAIDDGLHYTPKTYKRIYQYVMKFLKKH